MTTKLKVNFASDAFQHEPFSVEQKGSVFDQVSRLPQTKANKSWLMIACPTSYIWEPATIRQLITALFALNGPLTLSIVAEQGRLRWMIYAPKSERPTIRRLIYAVCPQADIQPGVDPTPHPAYHFPLQLGAPFLYPLQEIEAFGAFDPLVTLLSGMRELRDEEQWIYQLTLQPLDRQHRELGHQFLEEIWDGLDASTSRMLETKLNGPLKEARIRMLIQTDSAQRAHTLAGSSWPTFVQFARDGGNALAVPGPGTFAAVLSPGEVGTLWHLPNEFLHIAGISWSTSTRLPIPERLKSVSTGIVLGTNHYQGQQHSARLTYEDRDAHVTVIGRTGVGKSNWLHHGIHQDIQENKGVGLIDPHGDLYLDVLSCSIEAEREDDVILFDTHDGEACPIGLNPLSVPPGVQPYQVARQAFDLMRKLFGDDWPGAQTDRYLLTALQALAELPNTSFKDIPRLLVDPGYRTQVIAQIKEAQTLQNLYIYDTLNKGAQAKVADPILNRLDRFLSDPVLAHIICQSDSLNFREIIDNNKIFLANLGAFLEEREANTLGAIVLSKFQFAAMSRGRLSKVERQARIFYLHADELQRLTTDSLPIIYDQARKYGLSLTGAFQRMSQLPGENFKGIVNGVGIVIVFRPLRDDAKVLAPFLDERISAKDLADLDKYNAIVSSSLYGQTLPNFTIETMKPLKPLPQSDQRIDRIRQRCQVQFGQRAVPQSVEEVDTDDPKNIDFAG